MKKSSEYIKDRYGYAVDMDLRQFFNTVSHIKLLEVLLRMIKDGRMISRIHKYASAGVDTRNKFKKIRLGDALGRAGKSAAGQSHAP